MSQPDGPAAYSLYDLLRTLCDRVGWPTEQEKNAAVTSIDQAERMQVFGNLAEMMACKHPPEAMTPSGRCADCRRQILAERFHGRGADTPRYQSQSGRGW